MSGGGQGQGAGGGGGVLYSAAPCFIPTKILRYRYLFPLKGQYARDKMNSLFVSFDILILCI